MAPLIGPDFNAGHGQVDAGNKVLLDNSFGNLIHGRRLARRIQAPAIKGVKLIAADGDQALDGFGE